MSVFTHETRSAIGGLRRLVPTPKIDQRVTDGLAGASYDTTGTGEAEAVPAAEFSGKHLDRFKESRADDPHCRTRRMKEAYGDKQNLKT